MEAPRSASLRKVLEYHQLAMQRICQLAHDQNEARARLDYIDALCQTTLKISREIRRELAGDEVPPVLGASWDGRDLEADILRLLHELPGTDSNHEGSRLTR